MVYVEIRDLESQDISSWQTLWSAYFAFYKTQKPFPFYEEMAKVFLDPMCQPHAIVAIDPSQKVVGLAHYLFHVSTWERKDVCYMQDLFVAETVRKQGIAQALMKRVKQKAQKRGAPFLHWLTAQDNKLARKLYDQVGKNTGFIRYKDEF